MRPSPDPAATDDGRPSLLTPAFLALTIADLAYFTANGMLIPAIPLYAAGPLGADEVGVGIAVGAFSVTALVLRPIAGRAADRRGRRPLLIGGALLFGLVVAAHDLATDLPMLIALRLLLGVAEAFFFVASFAALADLAPPGRAGEALSLNSLSLYLGIALGPLLGQLLLQSGDFRLVWIGGAALAFAAAGLTTRIPETSDRERTGPPPGLVHRAAIGPSLGLFSGIAAMSGFFAFVSLRALEIGFHDWSLVLLEFGLIVVSTRLVFARLPDRVPPYRLGTAALVLTATGLALAAILPTALGLLAGAAILAVGVAFTTPAFFAAILSRANRAERGSAMATASIFLDLAFGGGPMLMGLVAGGAGIPAAFTVGAGVAALGAAWTRVLATGRPLIREHAAEEVRP